MPRNILIIDDEPNIVVPLQFLTEQNSYNVAVAETGEEAIEIILKFKPDLILPDILLPVLDGFEVCQKVRKNPECQKHKDYRHPS